MRSTLYLVDCWKKDKKMFDFLKKKNIIALIVTFVVGLVHFYINLPAINLHNTAFYTFFFTLSAIYCVLSLLFSGKIISNLQNPREIWSEVKTTCKIPVIICVVLLLINILGSLFSSVIFRANAYKDLLTVKEADFATEVVEISYDKIEKIRGFDIIVVTTANTDEEARELLKEFNMPFEK